MLGNSAEPLAFCPGSVLCVSKRLCGVDGSSAYSGVRKAADEDNMSMLSIRVFTCVPFLLA